MDISFPTAVYLLCFLTSSACAWLLGRSYWRTATRVLLWSALCFFLLALTNLLMVIDLAVLDEEPFRLIRYGLVLLAVSVLLFGFIWDLDE